MKSYLSACIVVFLLINTGFSPQWTLRTSVIKPTNGESPSILDLTLQDLNTIYLNTHYQANLPPIQCAVKDKIQNHLHISYAIPFKVYQHWDSWDNKRNTYLNQIEDWRVTVQAAAKLKRSRARYVAQRYGRWLNNAKERFPRDWIKEVEDVMRRPSSFMGLIQTIEEATKQETGELCWRPVPEADWYILNTKQRTGDWRVMLEAATKLKWSWVKYDSQIMQSIDSQKTESKKRKTWWWTLIQTDEEAQSRRDLETT